MNKKVEEQHEKDIQTALKYLMTNKGPEAATREKAEELLADMQALAHLIAHKKVEEEKTN
jgi:hypothetical protein